MELLNAILFGLVEGLTGFLPVSGTAHLALFEDWLIADNVNKLAYSAILSGASTLAIMVYFRSDIWTLLQALMRKLGRLPVNGRDLTMLYALFLGSVPTILLGLILETFISAYLSSIFVLLISTLIFIFILMYTEWRYYLAGSHDVVTVRKGLGIGLFQVLSIIPGFSHAGSALAGGILLGLSRTESARFAFILTIPIGVAFACKRLIDLLQSGEALNWTPLLFSGVLCFLVSLVVVHFFLDYIRRSSLAFFIWYNLVLAVLIAYVAFIV